MRPPSSHSLYVLILLFLLTLLGGCSTIKKHQYNDVVHPYGGTARALDQAGKVWHDYQYFGQFTLYAMDVPLCLVADTLVLPYDLYSSATYQ